MRRDHFEAERWAARASSVVLGPGGLWHDYTIQKAKGLAGMVTGADLSPSHLVQLPLMARAYGATFHAFGIGVGPLSHPAARAAVNLAGLLADSVTVRDEASQALLREVGHWPEAPVVMPDAAYALPLTTPTVTTRDTTRFRRPYLVVNVRPWPGGSDDLEVIRRVVFELAERRGFDVVGVPMQPVDETEMLRWKQESDAEHFDVHPIDADLADVLVLLKGASAVVAMRLHASLLAHRLGVVAVGLNYDPKVGAHFHQLGRSTFAIEMPVDKDALTSAVVMALAEGGLPEPTMMRVREFEKAASDALDQLASRIGAAPVRAAPPGMLTQSSPEPVQAPSTVIRPDPLSWDPADRVDLRNSVVEGGNVGQAGRIVPVSGRHRNGTYEFAMQDRAPKRGDFVRWRIEVQGVPGNPLRVELVLKQRYKERSQYAGRIAYQLRLGEELLFQHDVTAWEPRNTVWAAFCPSSTSTLVEVRLVALRDCEDWNWGPATALTVEGVRVLPWDGVGTVWGASSPYAAPAPAPSAEERERGTTAAGALGAPDGGVHVHLGANERRGGTRIARRVAKERTRRIMRKILARSRRSWRS